MASNSRVEFTKALKDLLIYAIDTCGYNLILDYTLRDSETQNRLFKQGKSRLDGYIKRSRHQVGLAVDLYILEDAKISDDKEKYKQLHQIWSHLGGREMIEWDIGHFEF